MDTRGLFQRAGLAPMRSLTLTITRHCNLRCAHCWPQCGSDSVLPGIASSILHRLIRQFSAVGITEICLTGGEPLTHPDWFALVQQCCDLPGLQRVRLQTNATLLTDDMAAHLAAANRPQLMIEVSIDGATAPTHDRIRGAGSYERTWRGLQALVRCGLGAQVVVAFTEMAHNFHELPRLLTLLKKLGVARLISGTLVSSGRAACSIETEPPTPAHYRDLLDRYYNDHRFKYDYRQMGNFAALEWLAGRSATVPHACRCADMPYVTADGILYPCLLLPHPSYAIAGVFSRPIEDILEQAASQWQDLSQWYNRRRTQLAQCLDCPGHGHCGGGCLGRAVAAGGDFMQVEDRCALRKAVYGWEPV